MKLTKSRLRGALDAERQRLIEFVRVLDERDLDAPTLCAEWRVRDVLGSLQQKDIAN